MRGIFPGWFVVAGAFAVTCLGFGSAYTFSTFLQALQQDFAASRGSVSLVFSLAGFLYMGFGIVSGPLADRVGARALAVAGMVLTGAGLALAGMAGSLAGVYAAYGLGVGLGVGCAYVPAVGAVQRWFLRRRGLASGLAVSGIGVGTLVMPPVAAALIDALGWRQAYLVLGILVAAAGAAMALLIANDPRDRGLGPDGDAPSAQRVVTGATLTEAVRTPAFARLYAACLLGGFGAFVPFVHLVPYALDHNVTPARAVTLLGLIGAGSTAGRFLLGGIADRLGRGRTLALLHAGMAATLALWAMAASFWPLAVFALLYGAVYGGWVAILPAVVMDRFGGRQIAGIIGVLYSSVAIGTLAGPAATGFIYDATGGYVPAILVAAIANLIAAAIALNTRKQPQG